MSEHDLKVGDELAFRVGFGNRWRIETIDKITKVGRIVCGNITLNPDLTVRGSGAWSRGPFCGEVVTDEIRAAVWRQRALDTISLVDWGKESDDALRAVLAAVGK